MARYVRGGGGQQWPIHALVTPALLTFSSLSLFLCARLTPPASYVGRPVREPFDLAVCDNSFISTPCNAGSLGLRDGDIGNVFAWPARALHGQMGPARLSFASNSPPTYYSSAPRVALGHWGGGPRGGLQKRLRAAGWPLPCTAQRAPRATQGRKCPLARRGFWPI